ncbi:Phage tail fiber [Collimonas arenae]|uniref:Phage tail fiber n=1 Tax=Collimonas arenae TaxID=279058 RepID=A0A0A1F8V0_9BURK|nr:glycosyl hydrolase family 28-related protein [Collimonas arenae]AIY40195.1 Phage tail fiber [Collimonas arenae]
MTVSTTTNSVTAQGNGLTNTFSFNFPVPLVSDLVVTYVDSVGNATVLTTAQYSVTGIGQSTGGAVTYPLSGSPIATGTSLIIKRQVPLQQLTSLVNQSGYYPDVVEGALDNLEMQIQQIAGSTTLSRALTFPIQDINPTTVLPQASLRANNLLSFDGNGNPIAIAPASQSATALQTLLATSAGSSLIGFLQSGTGAVSRTAQSKMRESISAMDFGVVGNGIADDTVALGQARDAANAANKRLYLPAGTYLISSDFIPPNAGMYGDSQQSTYILCNGCSAVKIPITMPLGRAACVIEKLSLIAVGTTCTGITAINIPGVASGAHSAFISGLIIRDIYMGANGNVFGTGIYAKDIFLLMVEDVVMTNVVNPCIVAGKVVQSMWRNVVAYNTGTGIGFQTVIATYSDISGNQGPEHLTTIDCCWISFARGINHTAGSLMIAFIDTDIQSVNYGAILQAPCYMHGGLVGADPLSSAWSGIYIPTYSSDPSGGIVLRDIEINPLSLVGNPTSTFLMNLGDNVTALPGIVISGCRFRFGASGGYGNAIFGRKLASVVIEDCLFDANVLGDVLNLTGVTHAVIQRNIGTATSSMTFSDDGTTSAYGSISDNIFGQGFTTLTLNSPRRWNIARTGGNTDSPSGPTFTGPWTVGSVLNNAFASGIFTVAGAIVGDKVSVGLTTQQGTAYAIISGYVSATNAVTVMVYNISGATLTFPAGTVNISVFKS